MNTNHTSGPWAVVSNGASVKVTDADGKAVCMLTPRRGMWNGDLIAAAPELLEALQMFTTSVHTCNYCDGSGTDESGNDTCHACHGFGLETSGDTLEAYHEARAAIAKATGTTNL